MIQRNSATFVPAAIDLRNVALSAPYFHTGQVWSLKEAVGIVT